METETRRRKRGGGGNKDRNVVGREREAEVEKKRVELTHNIEKFMSRDRLGVGDGESVPDTPPNESAPDDIDRIKANLRRTDSQDDLQQANSGKNSYRLKFEMDIASILLLTLGVITRLFRLDHPKNIVFDEMHYGKYASMYLKNTFFFDSNPPLGKMIIALAGHFANFDGRFNFEKIGQEYADNVPLWTLRFIPAMAGSLLPPLCYSILQELGLSSSAALLGGFMVLFDTAILTQSRFILMESIMMFFGLSSLFCVIKFRKVSVQPFTPKWFAWLLLAVTLTTATFSIKYIGIYTGFVCTYLIVQDFWRLLPKKSISDWKLVLDFLFRVICWTTIPIAIYLGLFSLHLNILYKAGTHDALMSSQFQASLEGGLGSLIRGQPNVIVHGSQITLRHTHGKPCWLHSHEHVYPVRYSDGRGSSHQQQVSCYTFKDVNNWWLVKRPDRDDLAVEEPLDSIKHGDIINLVHGMSHRALNSHDVAAPVTPHNQEVSCYIDYNISMPAENLWRVEITNRETAGDVWHTINSQVRLVHVNTSHALRVTHRQYPEWGFHQTEVTTDRNLNHADTVWNVEEHRYTKDDKDKETLEKELTGHEMFPITKTSLSFWEKFFELQLKMLATNQENVKNHNFASDPTEWPFLTRGIAYFISKDSNSQVHLIGNIVIWYTGTLSVVAYVGLLVFYILRRRRLCFDISEKEFQSYCQAGEIFLAGYLFHYIPYFFNDRTLFLHHYLPAYLYKIMLTSYMYSHFSKISRRYFPRHIVDRVEKTCMTLWILAALYVFYKFSSLCYAGGALTADEVRELRWKDSWDLIIHKK